jgi:hypothetical protein
MEITPDWETSQNERLARWERGAGLIATTNVIRAEIEDEGLTKPAGSPLSESL